MAEASEEDKGKYNLRRTAERELRARRTSTEADIDIERHWEDFIRDQDRSEEKSIFQTQREEYLRNILRKRELGKEQQQIGDTHALRTQLQQSTREEFRLEIGMLQQEDERRKEHKKKHEEHEKEKENQEEIRRKQLMKGKERKHKKSMS